MVIVTERTTRAACSPRGVLEQLYPAQIELLPDDLYLAAHRAAAVLQTQVAVFELYARFLPAEGRVLDWGCRHVPDACTMRARFGDALSIDGCDFVEPGRYSVFHEWAGLEYTQLDDVIRLPFENGRYDVVVSSGTLEHVAMDYESLKELHRILKPGGRLVLLYLPNRLSLAERYRRRVLKRGFHRRLYGLGELDVLLKRTGFLSLLMGYQTRLDVLPDRSPKHQFLRAM